MIKTRILIILVCIALIGIIVSQIYWLNQSYQISKKQFIKEVDISLRNYAIKNMKDNLNNFIELTQKQIGDSQEVVSYKMIGNILNMVKSVSGEVYLNFDFQDLDSLTIIKHDSLLSTTHLFLKRGQNQDSSIFRHFKSTISISDSSLATQQSKQQDKRTRDYENIKEELLKSGINIPFEMAMVDKKTHAITWSSRKDAAQFSAIPFKSDIISIAHGNYDVQLAFKEEGIFILKRMWQLLLISIMLIFISGFTFVYLLKTIFNQKKLNELKNDFINNITHELKTPISTMSVAIEAIQNFDVINDKQKTNEYLNITNNELFRLSTMIDKVLKTSAFEQNNIKFNLEKLNLIDLSETVIGNFKPQFEKHRVQFTSSYNSDAIYVLADKVHFTNVIYNLIDNAIKYSPIKPEISYKISLHTRRIFIEVKDNGIGIPTEYTDRIFEKFFRVPTGNVHNVKGYGLGLNYVKGVLSGHNGSISVKSEENRGTTFTIELPSVL